MNYSFGGLTGLLLVGEKGVVSHKLPGFQSLEDSYECSSDLCSQAVFEMESYFRGDLRSFSVPVDLCVVGDFARRVFRATREIPYGKQRSYSWIAERIGKPGAARAVGNALGSNPLPILIPCHRVIRKDGGLGGFSSGVEWKMRLIELEANIVSGRAVLQVFAPKELCREDPCY